LFRNNSSERVSWHTKKAVEAPRTAKIAIPNGLVSRDLQEKRCWEVRYSFGREEHGYIQEKMLVEAKMIRSSQRWMEQYSLKPLVMEGEEYPSIPSEQTPPYRLIKAKINICE
jgi:hypothetical protein